MKQTHYLHVVPPAKDDLDALFDEAEAQLKPARKHRSSVKPKAPAPKPKTAKTEKRTKAEREAHARENSLEAWSKIILNGPRVDKPDAEHLAQQTLDNICIGFGVDWVVRELAGHCLTMMDGAQTNTDADPRLARIWHHNARVIEEIVPRIYDPEERVKQLDATYTKTK